MLRINNRLLSLSSPRILAAVGVISRKEQKSHSTLTLQNLNPLVKEVEYAVRGKQIFFYRKFQ
jgi:hypothetical protein